MKRGLGHVVAHIPSPYCGQDGFLDGADTAFVMNANPRDAYNPARLYIAVRILNGATAAAPVGPCCLRKPAAMEEFTEDQGGRGF